MSFVSGHLLIAVVSPALHGATRCRRTPCAARCSSAFLNILESKGARLDVVQYKVEGAAERSSLGRAPHRRERSQGLDSEQKPVSRTNFTKSSTRPRVAPFVPSSASFRVRRPDRRPGRGLDPSTRSRERMAKSRALRPMRGNLNMRASRLSVSGRDAERRTSGGRRTPSRASLLQVRAETYICDPERDASWASKKRVPSD
jgi:hypothetical protein